jgi:hypothetical protein
MKFLIFGTPYTNSSAGVRVLYRLARELINLGYNSFVFTDWKETAQLRPHVGDCVVIYPEVICGNPLGAKNVVRYVLNYPGNRGGDANYPDSELVFVYNRRVMSAAQAATSQLIDDSRILELSVIEPWLFQPKPQVEKVYDVVFWVGKGSRVAQENMDKINGYLEGKRFGQITYEKPNTREDLASLFQSSHEFLTTDDFTAMLAESKLCGCKSLIMTGDGLVEYTEDVSRWKTNYYDVSPLENFVNTCRETFAL